MKTLGMVTQDGVYTNLRLLFSDQCVHTIKPLFFKVQRRVNLRIGKNFPASCFGRWMKRMTLLISVIRHTQLLISYIVLTDRDYPEIAVREVLLNLLVHREYSFRASTFISLYADRLEFTSIGGLVSGVSLKDITMCISICRNTKLANVFYRLELIVAYGTGIIKIMEAYEGTGMTPKIETSDNAFKVILPNLNAMPEPSRQMQINQEKAHQKKK